MIDYVLILAPVVIMGLAAFRTLRHMPWTSEWKPPSSRLSLMGVASTVALAIRALTDGWALYRVFLFLVATAFMIWTWRQTLSAEALHRERQHRMEGLGG